MQKDVHELFLNEMAVYKTVLGKGIVEEQFTRIRNIIASFLDINSFDAAIKYGNDCYKWFLPFEEYNALGVHLEEK